MQQVKYQFSKKLVERIIVYFQKEHNRTLTELEAQDALEELSDLYGLFSETPQKGEFNPP